MSEKLSADIKNYPGVAMNGSVKRTEWYSQALALEAELDAARARITKITLNSTKPDVVYATKIAVAAKQLAEANKRLTNLILSKKAENE